MPVVTDHTAILTAQSWNGSGVTNHPVILTYSFNTSAPSYVAEVYSLDLANSLTPFTTEEQDLTRTALDAWAAASGIIFIEVASGQGDIQFGKYDFHFSPIFAAGFAHFPNLTLGETNSFESAISGDIFMNQFDGVQFHEIIHEIGHALGFKHPFDGATTLEPSMDDAAFTVMAYNAAVDPTGLGPLDIAAAQFIYGLPEQDGAHVQSWSWDALTLTLTQTGTTGDDRIHGVYTTDIITGGEGSDILGGGFGSDSLSGDNGADYLHGGDGNDILVGGDGNDQLRGGAGDDLIIGGAGDDLMDGGAGFDIISFAGSAQGVVATLSNATGEGNDIYSLDVVPSIEGLIGSNFDDSLTGNELDNRLEGGGGADLINGDAGADTMIGGDGDDTYVVDNAGDVTSETSALGGTDTVRASLTRTLGANLENLVLTGALAINGFGNALANAITGNANTNQLNGFDGNDILDGGAGADNMFGGNGDDAYHVDNAGDQTTEVSALGGVDIVYASVSRNLTAHIENLTLTGGANITGSGNTLHNVITGNSGDNTLYGFEGNDRLDGGTGADTLFGANGNDTYVVDNAGDITVEGSALGGIDTVETYISRNLNANFENMTLLGSATIAYGNVIANVLTGNALANSLYGFDGNDTLDGGAGADSMFGANGDDTYIVDNTGDVTSEVSALGGVDTVISSVERNLTANLENLTLTGSANINGAGNALNNVVIGNSGANTLFGLGGADTLDGGLGADTLQGGANADTYAFTTALGGGNVDAIVGFSVVDDTIYLNNVVFTGLITGALAAGAFVVGSAASDADDRIIYDSVTGQLYFDADGSDAGVAVLFATLGTGLGLTSADFIIGGP